MFFTSALTAAKAEGVDDPIKIVISGAQHLTPNDDISNGGFNNEVQVTSAGALTLDGDWYIGLLDVAGSLILESTAYVDAAFDLEDPEQLTGNSVFRQGAQFVAKAGSGFVGYRVVSQGASMIIEGTKQADDEDSSAASATVLIQQLTADGGRTEISLGEQAHASDSQDVAVDGLSTLHVEQLEAVNGGKLSIRVGPSGSLNWHADAFEEQPWPDAFLLQDLPQGLVRIQNKQASLTSSMSIAIGGSDAERSEASKRYNLWIGSGGVLSVEGDTSKLTLGEGTIARFEKDSTIWIISSAHLLSSSGDEDGSDDAHGTLKASESDEESGGTAAKPELPAPGTAFAIEGLELLGANVSGLENVKLRFDDYQETGKLYIDGTGVVVGMMGEPEFSGKLAALISEIYLNRNELGVPEFYKSLFHYTPDRVEDTVLTMASVPMSFGTNDRLMQTAASTPVRIHSAMRIAERQSVRAAEMRRLEAEAKMARLAAEEEQKVDSEEPEEPSWFDKLEDAKNNLREKIPYNLRDIPVFVSAASGSTTVNAFSPRIGSTKVKSRDTTFEAMTVVGRDDLRAGLMGSFTTMEQGPFLMVPAYGPSTARSLQGDTIDGLPWMTLSWPITLGKFALEGVHNRAQLIDQESVVDNALDPYVQTRDVFLMYSHNKVNPVVEGEVKEDESAIDPDFLDEIDG